MALLTKVGDVLGGKLESKNDRARSSRLKMTEDVNEFGQYNGKQE